MEHLFSTLMFLTTFFLTYGEFGPKLVKISLSNFPESSTDPQTLFISPKMHFLWMKSTEVSSMILTYVLYTHLAVHVAYARAYNIYLITIVVRVICLSLK